MAENKIQDIYELSPLQQGMLFYTVKNPEAGLYIVQLTCRLQGNLDEHAFAEAWRRLIERHAILRTAFFWKEADKQLQVVYKESPLNIHQLDWRSLSEAEQGSQLDHFLHDDRLNELPFNQPPLMRLALIRLADDVYQFVWTYHHVLLDGWSLSQLLQEFFTLYETIRLDEPYQLPPVRPYGDYIHWLQKQDRAKAQTFWQTLMQGVHTTTPLPFDSHDSSLTKEIALGVGIEHGEADLYLSQETTAALQQLVKEHQLTLNTLVQAAWALTLSRYSGQTDVIFGTIVSGRPPSLPGVESIVGPFINTLPMRAHIDPAQPTIDWLKQLNLQQIEMRDYEYSALVDIQGWSDIPRGQSLFESSVVFENYPLGASLQDSNLSLAISGLRDLERTNFALGLLALPGPNLLLKLSYDLRRFTAETAEHLLSRLQLLLTAVEQDCHQPVGALPFLTEAEKESLITDWNQTTSPYPAGQTVSTLFEAQAEQTPNATAVTFADQTLTYAQLNQQANQLAHYLRQQGVGHDTLVGVNIERSLDLIIALLAIFKAGAAYLPLDPDYPDSRQAFIVSDSQLRFLLTKQERASQWPSDQLQIINLDEIAPAVATYGRENLALPTNGDDLAYVIYTSGSTGQPKGVLLTHEGIANLTAVQREWAHVGPGSHVLQFATLNFDGSVWEIFPPLCLGATLHLAKLETLLNADALLHLLADKQISLATLPPALLGSLPPAELPHLQTLLSVGEACPPHVVAQWAPGRTFINGYGPTECTVAVTLAAIDASDPHITIGRPIANKKVYVLDEQQRLVPMGMPGELCVGGVGLAKGYLNQPALTAVRFIADPFSPDPNAKLYRTGDRVRYLPDGRLEYLGRLDNQIKLRGFRIELEEIESHLTQQAGIAEAAVLLREDSPGDKQLVAYYRPDTAVADSLDPVTVRNQLRGRLPSYMVPSRIMSLDSFPLTANGKINRHALPVPPPLAPAQLIPPTNDLEKTIATIWQEVLQLEAISIEDNFFDLGGHSLLSMRVSSKLQQALKRDIPIVLMFQYPTIKSLAAHLSQGEQKQDQALQEARSRIEQQKAALQRRKKQMRPKR